MEIITLQEYTDQYVSLYEGEIRNLPNDLAMRLINKGVAAQHDKDVLSRVTSDDNGKILSVVNGKPAFVENSGGGGGGNPIVEYDPDTGVFDLTPRQFIEYAKAGKTPVNIYIESETDNSVDEADISVFVHVNYNDFGDGTKYYLYVAGEPTTDANLIYCEGYDDKFVFHG